MVGYELSSQQAFFDALLVKEAFEHLLQVVGLLDDHSKRRHKDFHVLLALQVVQQELEELHKLQMSTFSSEAHFHNDVQTVGIVTNLVCLELKVLATDVLVELVFVLGTC